MKILMGTILGLTGLLLLISLTCLGLFVTLNNTILNPNFILKEINKLNISKVTGEIVQDQLSSESQIYSSAIKNTIEQEKIWINQQIKQIVFDSYAYLKGSEDQLNIYFSLAEIKQNFSDNLVNEILKFPPPEYQNLTENEKDQYLIQIKAQIQAEIPSQYHLAINQESIGIENMNTLLQVKQLISYFQVSLFILIGFTVLMILLIALILRKIRGIARMIGIIFIVSGIVSCIAYLILKNVTNNIPSTGLSALLDAWINEFANDLLASFGITGLIILILGAIFLIVSILVHANSDITNKGNNASQLN